MRKVCLGNSVSSGHRPAADPPRRQDGGDDATLLTDADEATILGAFAGRRRTLTEGDNLLVYYAARPRHRRQESAYCHALVERRARTVLTSGGLEPVLDAGGGRHSVFAKAFLETLRADTGVIDGEGVFQRVRDLVILNAEQTLEYGDIRLAGHDGGDFRFVRKPQ